MIEEGSRIGRIRIEGRLGQGGMGSVYKGFDEILDRTVALKVSAHTDDRQPLDKLRFLREARVLSKLDHPNICRIYDLIERPEADILVLEYISGQTLKELNAQQALDDQQKLALFEKLAEVLAETHAVGIVHRDLKPDNVMITTDNQLKVLDFGLAHVLEESKKPPVRRRVAGDEEPEFDTDHGLGEITSSLTIQQGGVFGTPRYMSPEQAGGRMMTAASDMFSLGLVMLRLFTGKSLYEEGLSLPALVFRVSQGRFRDIDELTGDLDPLLAGLLRDLTTFDPTQRPTAEQTRQRLEFIRKKPIRQARRKKMAFVTLLMVVIGAFGFMGLQRFLQKTVLLQANEKANVLVFPVVNRTGEQGVEWGLRNMLAGTLSGHRRIQPIEERHIRDLVMKEGDQNRQLSADELGNYARSLGANFFVRAILERVGSGFVLRCTLYDKVGPRKTIEVKGSGMGLAARTLAEQLIAWLDPEASARTDEFSSSDLVNRMYAIGLEKQVTSGPKSSQPFFEICRTLDPDFHMATARYIHCLAQTGDIKTAAKVMEELEQTGTGQKDPMLQMLIVLVSSRINYAAADLEKAEARLLEALELAETHNARLKMAEIYTQLSVAKIRTKQFDEAKIILQKAVHIFEEEGNLHGKAKALSNMGVNVSDNGRLDEAEGYYKEALQIARDIEDRNQIGSVLSNLGVLMWERGDMDAAEAYYLEALEFYEGMGLKDQVATVYNNLAGVALNREDDLKVVDYFQRALAIFHETGYKPGMALLSYNLAEYHMEKKRCPQAEALIGEALAYFKDDPDTLTLAASIDACLDRLDSALDYARRAKELAGEAWSAENEAIFEEINAAAKDPR